MKILVTGGKGFVGKNLVAALQNIKDGKDRTHPNLSIEEIYIYDIDSSAELLEEACKNADFVFNLAGVNRPQNTEEFMQGNFGFASTLLETLQKYNNNCPVVLSSSIQATLIGRYDSEYGRSKKAGEELFFDYADKTGAKVLVYRFPNLFGKWCRPNYNSVVATFCNNIANDLSITVNDSAFQLELLYIDDLVDEMLLALEGKEHRCEFDGIDTVLCDNGKYCVAPITHKVTLGEIVELLESFKNQPQTLLMPEIPYNSFAKKLYSTYLSYLPKEKAIFDLKMNCDDRGSFTELLKTEKCGQFSVNISKPGITKGQHWHNTKWEFFIVVSGHGLIQMRKIGSDEVLNYEVTGDKIQAIHMLPGYTHNIINMSKTENLVTVMWANEQFDPNKPDTFFVPVEEISASEKEKQVLVLGGAGMAGYVISTYFKEQGYDVTVFDMTAVDGFESIVGSAIDIETLKKVVFEKPYCAVINCIGLLNRACDADRGLASYLNGYLPHFLSDLLKNTQTKLLHISSDCVFSGNNPPYTEVDMPDAYDNYGKTKAVGEVDNDKDITFRTSIVGPDRFPDKMGLVNWFMQQSDIKGFTTVMWSGVSTITLARAMKSAIEQNIGGIYHLVNNEFISKHDLLALFNKYLRNGEVKITAESGKPQKKIIVNTRTDFDFKVPTYEEMVVEIAEWIKAHPDAYSHYNK